MAAARTPGAGSSSTATRGRRTGERAAGPLRYNTHVLRGHDPLPRDAPADSPDTDRAAGALGSSLIRLQGVPAELAEQLVRLAGRAGAGARIDDAGADGVSAAGEEGDVEDDASGAGPASSGGEAGDRGVDVVLSAGSSQVEALRTHVSATDAELGRAVEEITAVLGAYRRVRHDLPCGERTLALGEAPRIMGVVNCTPDSFYAGSRARGDDAVAMGVRMVEEGADVLDVGGESTRPGSEPVEDREEIGRVVPVIEELVDRVDVPISVDTRKAAVAAAAVEAGATIVNDVSGLAYDPDLGPVVAEAEVPVILMHMRGRPAAMYRRAEYEDVVADVVRELREAVQRAVDAGVDPERTLVDPGIGFAKVARQSLTVLRHLASVRSLGRPIVVGPSRKSFLGAVLDRPAEERIHGTAAAVSAAVLAGAHLVRVHDVATMRQVAAEAAAIRCEGVGWIS